MILIEVTTLARISSMILVLILTGAYTVVLVTNAGLEKNGFN